MSWSVGIDLADPARLARRLQRRPALAEELFTATELQYCRAQHDPAQSLAGRFAVKEAVVKALALDGWDPLEIEVLEGDPAPLVQLHGAAADVARRRNVTLEISLTHLPTLAAGIAVAVPAQPLMATALARVGAAARASGGSALRGAASFTRSASPSRLSRLRRR